MNESQAEQLRQEREAFELRKQQASSWFVLRLAMGYFGLVLLAFSSATAGGALVVLGGDLLAVLAATWRLVLGPSTTVTLLPLTKSASDSSAGGRYRLQYCLTPLAGGGASRQFGRKDRPQGAGAWRGREAPADGPPAAERPPEGAHP